MKGNIVCHTQNVIFKNRSTWEWGQRQGMKTTNLPRLKVMSTWPLRYPILRHINELIVLAHWMAAVYSSHIYDYKKKHSARYWKMFLSLQIFCHPFGLKWCHVSSSNIAMFSLAQERRALWALQNCSNC